MTAQTLAAERAAEFDTDDVRANLAHRRWVRRTRPFAHVVAQNVFTPDFWLS